MKVIIYTLLVLAVVSCTRIDSTENKVLLFNTEVELKGKQLLSQKCYSCHTPNSISHDNILAPPMAAIKKKYKSVYKSKEEFISKLSSFILKPTKQKAIGPVHRFGLMPKVDLTKKEARTISEYIYDNELPFPKWLPEHWKEKHGGKF